LDGKRHTAVNSDPAANGHVQAGVRGSGGPGENHWDPQAVFRPELWRTDCEKPKSTSCAGGERDQAGGLEHRAESVDGLSSGPADRNEAEDRHESILRFGGCARMQPSADERLERAHRATVVEPAWRVLYCAIVCDLAHRGGYGPSQGLPASVGTRVLPQCRRGGRACLDGVVVGGSGIVGRIHEVLELQSPPLSHGREGEAVLCRVARGRRQMQKGGFTWDGTARRVGDWWVAWRGGVMSALMSRWTSPISCRCWTAFSTSITTVAECCGGEGGSDEKRTGGREIRRRMAQHIRW
jgi:hypothetical protein